MASGRSVGMMTATDILRAASSDRQKKNGPIELNAVAGSGTLILCVHGFPELWYSWRHQMAHFSGRGYMVAALDVRGYGGSSKPRVQGSG